MDATDLLALIARILNARTRPGIVAASYDGDNRDGELIVSVQGGKDLIIRSRDVDMANTDEAPAL